MNDRTSDLKFNTVMGVICTLLTLFFVIVYLPYARYLDAIIVAYGSGGDGRHIPDAVAFTLLFELLSIWLLCGIIHALYVQLCQTLQFSGHAYASTDTLVAA